MKTVSLKVAKVLKGAGYPQVSGPFYNYDGDIWEDPDEIYDFDSVYYAPTYIEAWLWLWREKQIEIAIDGDYCTISFFLKVLYDKCYEDGLEDPEEAIVEAIEYLCDNNLIK